MTRTIDLEQEKLGLEEVVALVEGGDEVVVTRGKEQIARVHHIEGAKPERQSLLGTHRGWVSYIADDFDAELPDSFWLGEE
jgi:antitoxin (DNA-binding transcriptional repressor) of toxin-antitoxin stability system